MLDIQVTSDLAAFNAILARYIALTGKLPGDVVRQKAIGVGLQIYRALKLRQWGGTPKRRGIARAELDARSSVGLGITVRPSILRAMSSQRLALAERRQKIAHRAGMGKARKNDSATLARNQTVTKNLWRAAVGKELAARDRGIGYLSAAFVMFSRRRSFAAGNPYRFEESTTDRRGRKIGTFSAGLDFARIDADARGLATVAARYGILRTAIQAETRDTLDYLARRHREIFL